VACSAASQHKDLRTLLGGSVSRRKLLARGADGNIPRVDFVGAGSSSHTVRRRLRLPDLAEAENRDNQQDKHEDSTQAHCAHSIAGDSPRKNAVVGARYLGRVIEGFIPVFADVGSRRLNGAQLVGAAGHEDALLPVPFPIKAKPGMRHGIRRRPEFRGLPGLSAVGGYLHTSNSASARPCQTRDLVEPGAEQLLLSGRKRDDRFRSKLRAERRTLGSAAICP